MTQESHAEPFSVEALRKGDRAEFARLVEAYSGHVYRLALRMLNNAQDAEDILQETFLKAFRHMDSFDGRSKVSTWLYRIATNEALMFLRRKHPDMISIDEPIDTLEAEQEPVQIVDWRSMPEEELLSSEGRAALNRAADNLPASLKIAFLLRDVEGLSTNEAAEVLNLSETAVKTRLSRARLRLREQLSEYYAERAEKQDTHP